MTKHKDYNLEFLRFIATLGVIFLHVGYSWKGAGGHSLTWVGGELELH